mmetsp:Transcript_700/g.875  ORF Transcript_700/g.875 Transcript_700/m.875 type:complete len:198 (-) Transcript_700:342-935(-)
MYDEAVKQADKYLGDIIDFVENTVPFQGRTLIIASSDHGFADVGNHAKTEDIQNYKIPFYVMGPCVAQGADLYDLNTSTRQDPGDGLPHSYEGCQPIRNRDAASLAADALGVTASSGALSDMNATLYLGQEECGGSCPLHDVCSNTPPANTTTTIPPVSVAPPASCKNKRESCSSNTDCCGGLKCHRRKNICKRKKN